MNGTHPSELSCQLWAKIDVLPGAHAWVRSKEAIHIETNHHISSGKISENIILASLFEVSNCAGNFLQHIDRIKQENVMF